MSGFTPEVVAQLNDLRVDFDAKMAEIPEALAEAMELFSDIMQLLTVAIQAELLEAAEEVSEDPAPSIEAASEPQEYPLKDWDRYVILNSGARFQNWLLKDLDHVGLSAGLKLEKAAENILIENTTIDGASKWGSRIHNAIGVCFKNCSIRDVNAEHGIYANVGYSELASLFLLNVDIHNCGSQAVQTVWRERESDDIERDRQGGGLIFLHKVSASRTGWNSEVGRPSYAFTFGDLEGADRPVQIEDCTLDNTMLEEGRGMLLIEPRSWARVMGSTFRHTRSTQTSVVLRGIRNLEVRGCHFEALNPSDYDRIRIDNCDRVTFQDCTGNLPVYVDGAFVGPVGEVSLTP